MPAPEFAGECEVLGPDFGPRCRNAVRSQMRTSSSLTARATTRIRATAQTPKAMKIARASRRCHCKGRGGANAAHHGGDSKTPRVAHC